MISRWTLWDLVIATVVATIAFQYRSESLGDVLIGFAMAAVLVLRRHAPVRVFAAVSALALLQLFVAEAVPAGYDLAVVVAMVAVVSHARPFWPAYAAAGVVGFGVLLTAAQQMISRDPGLLFDLTHLGEQLALAGACGAAWLIAYVVRFNQERAASAERERDQLARLAAADERAFIARELHDVVAHSLAVMIAQADGASYTIDGDPDRAREAMRTVAGTGRDALDDMHRIVAVLRDTADEELPERRRRGVGELTVLAERARAAGLDVALSVDGATGRLSAAEELTVFRIVQEGLTNVLRHAGPGARVEVTLHVGRQAVLEISDDGGAGATAAPAGGNGLVGMRERVAVHNGELTAGPKAGGGWRIRATIPVREAL